MLSSLISVAERVQKHEMCLPCLYNDEVKSRKRLVRMYASSHWSTGLNDHNDTMRFRTASDTAHLPWWQMTQERCELHVTIAQEKGNIGNLKVCAYACVQVMCVILFVCVCMCLRVYVCAFAHTFSKLDTNLHIILICMYTRHAWYNCSVSWHHWHVYMRTAAFIWRYWWRLSLGIAAWVCWMHLCFCMCVLPVHAYSCVIVSGFKSGGPRLYKHIYLCIFIYTRIFAHTCIYMYTHTYKYVCLSLSLYI